MLGTIGASAVLGDARWDESVARCILANYRTTGKYGFRGKRIDQPQLAAHGWKHYFASETVNYAPHYEAYLWAVYLWAYERTGYRPFLDRTATAIRMTMHAYPDEWRWTNGLQQERARMLLPLAWLVRIEDTPEHRAWLATVARDLLAAQDSSGALREEIGSAGKGDYGPPKSNDCIWRERSAAHSGERRSSDGSTVHRQFCIPGVARSRCGDARRQVQNSGGSAG